MLEAHKKEHERDDMSEEIMWVTVDVTEAVWCLVSRYHRLFGNKQIDLTLPDKLMDLLEYGTNRPTLPWGEFKRLIIVYKCNGFRWIFEAEYNEWDELRSSVAVK